MEEDAFFVCRPSDLATLIIRVANLELDGTRLRRTTEGETAAVMITLPPQHFRENPRLLGELDLAAAAPTSLAFLMPDGTDELELGEGGVLGLCEQLLVSAEVPFIIPARASMLPLDGHWQLSSKPELLGGRGSLWRAKLVGPVHGDEVVARFQLAEVADSEIPAWDVLPSSAGLRQFVGGVFEARRMDLSPIGATVRLRGPVDFGDGAATGEQQQLINNYEHDIDFGRDTHVRLVSHGHLSSGHPAILIRVRRRVFIGGCPDIGFADDEAVAFLDTVNTIMIEDPVVDVGALSGAYGGEARDMPFRVLRMVTTSAPGIDDPPFAAEGIPPFWVQSRGQDFRFAPQGTDWSGQVIDFSSPLVFIPDHSASPATFSQVFHSGGAQRRTVGVGSKPVALIQPSAAAPPMTVESVVLGFQQAIPGVTSSPVLPVVASVHVIVDAATHFTGVRSAVEAVWHQAYRDHGLDAAANKLGAYLSLPRPLTIGFGDPRRVGGLAQPDMTIAALTLAKGAVPAGFDLPGLPDVNLIKQQFSGAKLLGFVPLKDIVDFGSLTEPPELSHKITTTEAVLTYDFKAPLHHIEGDSMLQPIPGSNASVHLRAVVSRRFADGATATTISGNLTKIQLSVAKIVTLSFDSLEFHADPGKMPELVPHGLKLGFDGTLSFLETLAQQLEKLGLGGLTVRVATDRITAGLAITVPSLGMGMFAISNLTVTAVLTVPFNGDPIGFTFGVGERFKPFSVMVSLFTGGGFLALTMTSRGISSIEAALEFGGSMQLNLIVASGGLSVMAGIYLRYDEVSGVTLGGYVRASGQVTVLGILTISADFFLQLSYEQSTGKAIGQASLTLGVKVLFFSKSVTLHVERKFSSTSGDPTFTELYEIEDWEEYCDAFA
jgi:hypothetical protein